MKNLFSVLFIFFLISTWTFAQNCTIGTTVGSTCTLTMDGVLTIPAGVDLMIEVKAWGAGGGSQSAKNRRSGGGGGAYFNTIYSVSGGSTFPITVGEGVIAMAGGDTSFDFDGSGLVIVGGGGMGSINPGLGGTGVGSVPGGDGGAREKGGLGAAGGGGGGSGPGNGPGGEGGDPTNGIGGVTGVAGTPGAAGGAGGNHEAMGATSGTNGAFPGGGGGGKATTVDPQDGTAGGNGQVIVCVTAVLPVELVRFNATSKDKHILLEWQTASELNNEGFEIQKSKDGIVWDKLEFVEGKGTTSILNTYACIDNSPTQGPNYYRLKQMDFDRKFEYSKTISVVFNRQNEIIIFPNPVDDQLIIEANISEEVNIQIYNTLGKEVYQNIQFMDRQLVIDVSTIKIGNYYLKITNAKTGVSVYQQPVVKK